ncbi:sulfotransferase [Actinopolymorpha sp. B17G11]|uniref:sulfotransferase family protein n=1 Tax=Actinopolymorpha sp. B17G11 TaxID=3160861 RepID=UPI0032E4868C
MNLLEISRAEREAAPVFIVGEARSGTTILSRILEKHEAFRPREVNLRESAVMAHANQNATYGPRLPSSLHGYMGDSQRYEDFLASLAPIRHLMRTGIVLQKRIPSQRAKDLIWAATGHVLLVRSYFHHARLVRGARRVVEKTPSHIHHVNRLLRCYPRARLIYIHRHPVDVYSSYVRRSQIDPKSRSWTRMSLKAFAKRWEQRTTLAIEAADRLPDAFLLLPYADFTGDAQTTMKRVCHFVGEEFDPEIIMEREPDLTRLKETPHVYGQIVTKTKDWSDYLSAERAARLQELLAPMMARLSYPPYGDPDRRAGASPGARHEIGP